MLAKKINNLSEISGILKNLTNGKTIHVESMKLDKPSEIKLLKVLNDQSIKDKKDQNLFISELSIKAEDADDFRKGQSSLTRNGNTYSALTDPISSPRYAADMYGSTDVGNNVYECNIKIGSIVFDIIDNFGEPEDYIVIFKNLSAEIYPSGKYSIEIVK